MCRAGKRAIRGAYWGMDDDQFQTTDFLLAILLAPITAVFVGFVAHYIFGVSRLNIQTSAMMGAVALAVIVALIAAIEFYGKPRKSK
jgi:hypothetical protein